MLVGFRTSKLKVFKISIDDFYKTRKDRMILAKKVHPLLMTRGVPGTHDVDLILSFFRKVSKKRFSHLLLPKFDKSIDDRVTRDKWYKIKKKPNALIFLIMRLNFCINISISFFK